jgi:hypothetical protein
MEGAMKIHGGCHCGNIRYEAEVDPAGVGICHCTDCQTLSGSAFRLVVSTKAENFKLVSGATKTYVKTAESGNKRAQAFCENCGTRLYASAVDDPQLFNVRLGTLAERAALRPSVQLWFRSALPWVGGLDAIKQLEKQ